VRKCAVGAAFFFVGVSLVRATGRGFDGVGGGAANHAYTGGYADADAGNSGEGSVLGYGTDAGNDSDAVQPKSSESLKRFDTQFFDMFDTVTVLSAYAGDQGTFEEFAQEFARELRVYHELYDIYHDYAGVNNIKTINDMAGVAPVAVDAKILDLLEFSKEMHALTQGRVNVAMGSVLALWHQYRDAAGADPSNSELPPMDALRAAAQHMDIDLVIIDRTAGTVFLADPDMRLDVGAVAKGYALQRVCEGVTMANTAVDEAVANAAVDGAVANGATQAAAAGAAAPGVPAVWGVGGGYTGENSAGHGAGAAARLGIPAFCASVGGNVKTVGMKEPQAAGGAKEPWKVGIQNPDLLGDKTYLYMVPMADLSLVTSGGYQRYYTVGGKRYHHIIRPDTLMPWDMYESVSILCEDSGLADALSTAVFNMYPDEGMALVEGLDGVEALWIMPDGSAVMTSGFRAEAPR
jgi:thiamine biosynthesis lipoprotein